MSTTGPVTRATRPTPPSVASTACDFLVAVAMVSLPVVLLSRTEGVSAAHDLGNLLGDLRLARVVRKAGVVADELVGVVARRLHRLLRGGLLRGGRLQQCVEDAALDVDRE